MARRQTTSMNQVTSSRVRGSEGSFSAQEFEGDDYPMDGMAPDDHPVRDIRGDEEDWHCPDEAEPEAQGEPSQVMPDAQAIGADSSEAVSALTELAVSAPTPDHRALVPEAHAPVQPAEVGITECPAQPLLPRLEAGRDDAPQRLPRPKRPRGSSRKRALNMAQIELWPRPESSDSNA
jgi:hypothetical protein